MKDGTESYAYHIPGRSAEVVGLHSTIVQSGSAPGPLRFLEKDPMSTLPVSIGLL